MSHHDWVELHLGGESPAYLSLPHIYTYTSSTTAHLQHDPPPHFIRELTHMLILVPSSLPDTCRIAILHVCISKA